MSKERDPKCRKQPVRGFPDRVFVAVKGKRIYLGIYDSPESRHGYHQVLCEVDREGFLCLQC